ncbi:hypothetical protein Ga0466249_004802 [Sporomusaceae bacterium BoRhaA]|uniref:hypothetical protein n=1 Tax=Pelorhabdus rhamnosifermentans TaxID=2772457 RepID=UPI001C0617C2|nr:hypothetical protein [Pelorhabdus rhamnosifermentans]MBU2703654.1 hypothetical protein [Pelorhabdus rhamnosifermentans]
MANQQSGEVDRGVRQITTEFIHEFAELNLAIVKDLRKSALEDVKPELLHELRENAQALDSFI